MGSRGSLSRITSDGKETVAELINSIKEAGSPAKLLLWLQGSFCSLGTFCQVAGSSLNITLTTDIKVLVSLIHAR